MAAYTFGQLEDLWTQAGGPRKLAPTMAAIALAESGGNPRAVHHNPASVHSPATTDRGLWQINSSHGYGLSSFDPKQNARQAVAVYHSQGLHAWTTYTLGTYQQHLAGMTKAGASSFGVFAPEHFAGVDQGVDFTGAGVIPALDPGVVTWVGRGTIIEGGSYPVVVYHLTGGPHKGRYVYVAENFTPTVRVGQQLKRGQPVGRAAGQSPYIEQGFNSSATGWNPVAPLGSDPHAPTGPGKAMAAYIGERIGSPLTPSGPKPPGPRGPGFGNYPTDPQATLTGNATAQAGAAVAGAVGQAAHQIAHPFEAIASFLGKLTDPGFWLRALELVGGILLVLIGLYLLARQVGLAQPVQDIGSKLPGAQLSEEAASAFQVSPGTRSESAPRTRRVVHQHYLDERPKPRAISDPATNEIPY